MGDNGAMTQSSARARWSWAFYDWANSPYTTLVVTFVFPAYFAVAVVGDPVRGQELWGYAMGLSGLLVALTAPLLGAVADAGGRRKPWIGGFTLLCASGAAGLWLVAPDPVLVPLALVLTVLGTWGFEAACVFYNAMLPDLAEEGRVGRLSGWAWGLGYAGGLAALLVALVVFVLPEAPLMGKAEAANIRILGPLAAVWLLLFAVPLFLWVPDGRGLPAGGRMRAALGSLARTLRDLGGMGPVGRFLLAAMLYGDGLSTLFAMGGVYVAGVHGFKMSEVLAFGVLLNVTAGLGAVAFAWVDDRIGGRATVIIALIGLLAAGALVLAAPNRAWVWGAGAAIGIFVGPAQAAGRSYLVRLAPRGRGGAELFGLYALSGKATAFMGPWLVATVTAAAGSQTAGMTVILAFFAAGLAVMATIKPPTASTVPPSPG